jgi:hypothetical protein
VANHLPGSHISFGVDLAYVPHGMVPGPAGMVVSLHGLPTAVLDFLDGAASLVQSTSFTRGRE